MGRKAGGRKTPPPQVPDAGWRLLPPATVGDDDPAVVGDPLGGIVAAMTALRAEFVQVHGREPTEAEVIELVSLGLADGLNDDFIADLLRDEEVTSLDLFPVDADEDEDDEDEDGDEEDEDEDDEGFDEDEEDKPDPRP